MKKESKTKHEEFMRECFKLARKGSGFVSPNPLVGSVLVVNGKTVARGFHRRFGGAHAEVDCLRNYGGDLTNATLYVNLEPCSHFGKTPPCSDLIIQRGVGHVVVAMDDPNPRVSGRGIRKLRRAGIRVTTGVLKESAKDLNRFFVKHITKHLPYVHVKIAQSIDGFIGKRNGPMQYLTSVESRRLVHEMRREYDAVLVGSGTIKADNPRLNVRLVKGRDPDLVILDGKLSLSGNEKVFSKATERRIFVCGSERSVLSNKRKIESLTQRGVTVIPFPSQRGVIDLKGLLSNLYSHRIGSLLVEGGSNVFTQFLKSDFVDEISLFVSPKRIHDGVPVFSDSGESLKKLEGLILTYDIAPYIVGKDVLLNGIIH